VTVPGWLWLVAILERMEKHVQRYWSGVSLLPSFDETVEKICPISVPGSSSRTGMLLETMTFGSGVALGFTSVSFAAGACRDVFGRRRALLAPCFPTAMAVRSAGIIKSANAKHLMSRTSGIVLPRGCMA
jgi:hypothetical protein